MITREQYITYDKFFMSNNPNDISDYEKMMLMMNEYEKQRNRSFEPQAKASMEEKSRMENMVDKMRRKDPEEVRDYSKALVEKIKKGEPVKLPTYGNSEVPVYDLSYVLAETLQHLYSGEDPKAEYYDWVQIQRKIEVDINTNGTTDGEIAARNLFIGYLGDRETELKLVIDLYAAAERGGSGYYKEMAQNKLSFLQFKLSELRRLRDRTEQTKNKSDEQERREKAMEEAAQKAAMEAARMAAIEQSPTTNNYLQNLYYEEEFGTAVEGVMATYRPVTRSIHAVMAKKEKQVTNLLTMREVINGLRQGKSKEEQEMEHLYADRSTTNNKNYAVRSFDRRIFERLRVS